MMLRPLLPLLMLIPVIALASAGHSAAPIAPGVLLKPTPIAFPADTLRKQQAAVRILTAAVQPCVRTGNRMVC